MDPLRPGRRYSARGRRRHATGRSRPGSLSRSRRRARRRARLGVASRRRPQSVADPEQRQPESAADPEQTHREWHTLCHQHYNLSISTLESPRTMERVAVRSYVGTVRAPDFPEGLDWLNVARPLHLADLRGRLAILD